MKVALILALLATCAHAGPGPYPHTEIWGVGRPEGRRLSILLVPDGWTKEDLDRTRPKKVSVPSGNRTTEVSYPTWPVICEGLRDGFLQKEPFKTYRNMLRITRVDVDSPESGVSRQSTGTVKNTEFGCGYQNRMGTSDRGFGFADVAAAMQKLRALRTRPRLARHVVACLVNDPGVEGRGTAFPTGETGLGVFVQTPAHPRANATFAHEMGHALANLGDEYFENIDARLPEAKEYERYEGTDPLERNLTTDPQFRKWAHWADVPGIGAYPGGSRYKDGIFHPTTRGDPANRDADCGMCVSERDYCVVCRERLIQRLYETVDLVDTVEPPVTRWESRRAVNPIRTAGTTFTVTTVGPVTISAGGELTSDLICAFIINGRVLTSQKRVIEAGPVFTCTLPPDVTSGRLTLLLKDLTTSVRSTPDTAETKEEMGGFNVDPLERRTKLEPSLHQRKFIPAVRCEWQIDIRPDAASLPGLTRTAETR